MRRVECGGFRRQSAVMWVMCDKMQIWHGLTQYSNNLAVNARIDSSAEAVQEDFPAVLLVYPV
jgi:hypothetical protein